MFYSLLTKYRTRNLENFNMDDEDEEDRKPVVRRPQEKRQHVVTQGAIASRSRKSRQSLSNIAGVAGGSPAHKRPPSRIVGGPVSPPHITRPAPAAPGAMLSSPRGPRPLPPAPASMAKRSSATPSGSRVPAIHLQHATPDTLGVDGPERAGGWESVPPSPSPAAASGFELPEINIPQTGDAAMQQFFQDIVGQLHNISARNSVAGSSPTPGGAGRFSFLGPNGTTSPTFGRRPEPASGGAGAQFEDAEDDESDIGTTVSSAGGAHRAFSPYPESTFTDRSRSPVPPLNQAPPVRPRVGMRGSSRETTAPLRPNSRISNFAVQQPSAVYSADKENVRRVAPPVAPRPTGQATYASAAYAGPASAAPPRATLGLAIQNTQASPGFDFELVERPTSPGALRAMQKQHNGQPRRKAVAFSPNPSVHSSHEPPSPKQSWFSNLFSWKQPSYTLMSTSNVSQTRNACKKMLEQIGVTVTVQNADGGVPSLKCRTATLRDPATGQSSGALKAVKFRVDFGPPSKAGSRNSSPMLGTPDARHYATMLTLVMEKGAHSTFTAAYNQLRSGWELDTPRSEGFGLRLIPSPMPSPALSGPNRSPVFV